MAETLTVQMERILDDYSLEVKKATNRAIKTVVRGSVSKLRASSPKRKGKYASGWGSKTEGANSGMITVVIYNKTAPSLTHLLERGHVVRNKKGTYGRAPAHPHIKPVETWANSELPEEIERELR